MKILLADDHALFAKSLAIALSDFPQIERFEIVKDIRHLDVAVFDMLPDILLIDINLGKAADEDGLQLTGQLLKRFPNQKIAVLSGYDLPVYRKEAQRLGARGFINKEVEPEELLNILLSINKGAAHFPKDDSMIEDLTGAEKQVLRLLADGMKRKEIAQRLFLSERTVSNHLQHIFEKLEVGSAVEAVARAVQLGHIPPLQ